MDETQFKKIAQDAVDKYAEISNRKLGDTPTDAIQLTPKKYVDAQTSILAAGIVGLQSSIAGISVTNNFFGTGADGSVTVSSASVLSRDMYYDSLTVTSSSTLNPGGYKIYVKDTLTINSGSKIARIGNNGSNAVLNSGGVGGVGLGAGTLSSVLGGITGGNGGNARVAGGGAAAGSPGADGTVGVSMPTSIGANGASNTSQHGGDGGQGSGNAGGARGTGAAGGTVTNAQNLPSNFSGSLLLADLVDTYMRHQGSASTGGAAGGGGGGGAGSAVSAAGKGGGGGGNGGNGGIIAIYAKTIVNNATGGISVKGGDGGDAANGSDATGDGATQQGGGGGGNGGCGGTGGVIVLMYKTLTQNGSFDISGGTYGNFGNGGASNGGGAGGQVGQLGTAGASGVLWQYQV